MRRVVAHARFAAIPALQVVTIATLVGSAPWTWLGAILLLIMAMPLDQAVGSDRTRVEKPNRLLLNGLLYAVVPLQLLMTLCLLLQTAQPGALVLHIASQIGIDPAHSKSWLSILGALISVGVVSGPAVGAFGHELIHRRSRAEWWLGQVLLATCLYAPFALEHVHGHHRQVGTSADVATVPRGMSVWRHLRRAILGVYRGAARIEASRLRRRKARWLPPRNRFVAGLGLEICLLVLVLNLGGASGLVGLLLSASIGVFVIELSNYVGHYGLVRVPGQPIRPRHSWNSSTLFSTSLTLNLSRHSDHHQAASTPYWALGMLDEAPVLPYGLGTMSVIAMWPSAFFRLVNPVLEDCDRRLATSGERALVKSGITERAASMGTMQETRLFLAARADRQHGYGQSDSRQRRWPAS